MFYICTTPAPGVHVVRFHPDSVTPYDRGIVVSEQDDGTTLFLELFIGKPLTSREWREGRDRLFPTARRIKFHRRNLVTGENREVILDLGPPKSLDI